MYRAIIFHLSRDYLDLSRDTISYRAINCIFIARYKNVSSVSSMGHRRNQCLAHFNTITRRQRILKTPSLFWDCLLKFEMNDSYWENFIFSTWKHLISRNSILMKKVVSTNLLSWPVSLSVTKNKTHFSDLLILILFNTCPGTDNSDLSFSKIDCNARFEVHILIHHLIMIVHQTEALF